MPTPIQSADKLAVGSKSGGKHWTKAEVEARQNAAQNLSTGRKVLRAPSWLSKEAKAVWKTTVARLKGIELLDALDTDLLAMYCDIVANYRALSSEAVTTDDIKLLQSWARLAQSYADKLGLSPAGRARLAKRKAEEKPPSEFEEEFD